MVLGGKLSEYGAMVAAGLTPYRIVLADDHALLRECIRQMLSEHDGLEVVGEAADGAALLAMLRRAETIPDMIILDLSMPNLEGIEATRIVKKIWPQTRIMILTVHKERAYVDQALAAGAEGFVLKDDADAELFSAIDTIRNGNSYISRFFSTCRKTTNP